MNSRDIQRYADMLYEAERDRRPIPPLTEQDTALTVADAYAIQMENVSRVTAMGHVVSGKKLALPPPASNSSLV